MGEKQPVLKFTLARVLDANLNRAREGLRVLEDTCRFYFNDAAGYKRLRIMRHRLHDLTKEAYPRLVAARDSDKDAGRLINEGPRQDFQGVLSSNMRRAQEAVRVLEEYSKVFSPRSGGAFKSIRYQLYREEKSLLGKLKK